MKKRILLFLLCFPLSGQLFAADQLRIMESMVMPSRILKQDIHFSVCLPQNYYADNQSYPVVYLLHGLGDDETAWLEYGRISQYADQSVQQGVAVPMIFIMPEGFRTYYVNDYKGTFLYQDMFVQELVPHIDSLFRTRADSRHRSLMGYSMGGFGALILHLKYPDIFGSTVPLSISVRTDEQYMTEDAGEWDQQWGRLFGGQGLTGGERLTGYYRQNSPFHVLSGLPAEQVKKLNIYIDNGDKEGTLCRSNEELHILMHTLNIPHQFRVREGGHSFDYWTSALQEALRFISAVFESKPFPADRIQVADQDRFPDTQVLEISSCLGRVFACLPEEYSHTNRLYPVAYFAGNFSAGERMAIAASVFRMVSENSMCPLLLVFLPVNSVNGLIGALPELEGKLRIRQGFRFRALVACGDEALEAFRVASNPQQFSSCALSDAVLLKIPVSDLIGDLNREQLKRLAIYLDAPDAGKFPEGNGNAHMLLRDRDIAHEYRVREGNGGFGWFMAGLPALISYTAMKFHR